MTKEIRVVEYNYPTARVKVITSKNNKLCCNRSAIIHIDRLRKMSGSGWQIIL
jgi:hypothetical protein